MKDKGRKTEHIVLFSSFYLPVWNPREQPFQYNGEHLSPAIPHSMCHSICWSPWSTPGLPQPYNLIDMNLALLLSICWETRVNNKNVSRAGLGSQPLLLVTLASGDMLTSCSIYLVNQTMDYCLQKYAWQSYRNDRIQVAQLSTDSLKHQMLQAYLPFLRCLSVDMG